MKNWIAKYQKAIVGTGAVSVLLICFLQQKELSKLRAEVKQVRAVTDSLQAEIYPCQIELGRFQTAYQIFIKRNPKAASQYGNIISDETE